MSCYSYAERHPAKNFSWLRKTIEKWVWIAEQTEYSDSAPEFKEGIIEDLEEEEMEQIAEARWNGLRQNRFLYSTAIDLAIANGDTSRASELIDKVVVFDKMRAKYWQWKKDRLKA